ncbi:uncharacterized protein LOC18433403 isoform X2 [Amborella trichopoda]|uniref:uncharacterized protein LOC18433403 isoform X2 n=1 Tax=Amborella trichopoda TaxID=13333 RepID=UPI0009BF022B|nr:uncharacterized protein LOC18433403 isoform X2 [Amborella trichopoda]|eukprot:XP_020522527.1 uncharacterized protein LOC18433403 isoform X2 [Amborella trichopoda]
MGCLVREMKHIAMMISRAFNRFPHQPCLSWSLRSINTSCNVGDIPHENGSDGSFETADEFERRIFSGIDDNNPRTDSIFAKFDRLENARGRGGFGSVRKGGDNQGFDEGLDGMDAFNTLSDGMDGKLKEAAMSYPYTDEISHEDYSFRPDVRFVRGMTYTTKDLDLTKPAAPRSPPRAEFEVTTKEVLKKADFRNVRFLAKFLTEAGIIIQRSKTKISAKAQRRVAREIKTARAFGLMPFTTMGKKPFVFGKTMEDLDEDYEYDFHDSEVAASMDMKEEDI